MNVRLPIMNTSNKQIYKFGQCVHCLKQSDEINDDHVLPSAWYPDDTPGTEERWTVPSCVRCNKEHGKNEQDLLIRLGLCLGPEEAKALRSIQSEAGGDERDASARAAKRREILSIVDFVDTPQTEGVLPNFGVNPSLEYPTFALIKIPAAGLITLGKKIVRGVTHFLEKRFIEDDEEVIDIFFVADENGAEIAGLISKFGQTFHKGPGVTVMRAVTQDGERAGLFLIEIWGRLKIYASLLPKQAAS